ncbi:MAG: diaminopimelate decarboxylase [Deltaproteobacteria bacterium]|nr:diaminopimelate decarboxylase [Deltaproteobacteria bacterium]
MNFFQYRGSELCAEEVPLSRIADQVGTPCYVYSLATLRRHYRVFDDAFGAVPHLVCYSVKANSNLAVLRAFAREGSGFDIVSGGELHRVLAAGADPRKIVFSGIGKTRDEMAYALREGILQFNVESAAELDALDDAAREAGRKAPVALRVNPDVDPKTHPYISTGMKKSKFGIDIRRALEEYERARTLSHLEVVGVDCHIGSQLTDVAPFRDALSRVRGLVLDLRARGFDVRHLDFGGGLGITYDEETPPEPRDYAAALLGDGLDKLGVKLLLEPGRVIVGNAGILLTRVLYRKDTETKKFVIVDGAMNDLIRPALYGAYQEIEPVKRSGRAAAVVDVVGPVCESGDFLAKDRELPETLPGELLAVRSAGAYGFVMSSNYNSRPRAAEVLVDGAAYHVVRARETLDDLVRGETIPETLR